MRSILFLASVLMLPACGCAGSGLSSEPPRTPLSLVCTDRTGIFLRPDSASSIFGVLSPGDTVSVPVRTSDGWMGFDPGVAQAGNVGIFRFRWVPPDGAYELLGDTVALFPTWTPSAGVPYAMALEDIPVLSEPDSLSSVTDTLPAGSAATIIQRDDEWYRVDLLQGPLERYTVGWVRAKGVSVSEDPGRAVYP